MAAPWTSSALVTSGWGSRSWNWGSAIGKAHDAAFEMRNRLSTLDDRRVWLNECASDSLDVEEIKLCLALRWQRSGHERTAGDYSQIMEAMARGNFEGDDRAPTLLPALVEAMPSIGLKDERAMLEILETNQLSVHTKQGPQETISIVAAAILLKMGFLDKGL